MRTDIFRVWDFLGRFQRHVGQTGLSEIFANKTAVPVYETRHGKRRVLVGARLLPPPPPPSDSEMDPCSIPAGQMMVNAGLPSGRNHEVSDDYVKFVQRKVRNFGAQRDEKTGELITAPSWMYRGPKLGYGVTS
jgi:hypothetical protein